MSKTFSDEQMKVVKIILDMQQDINNKINNKLQETFLRKDMNNLEINLELESLKKSVLYTIDEEFKQMHRG